MFLFHSSAMLAQGTGAVRKDIDRIRRMTDTLYIRSLVTLAEQVAERMPDSALKWSGQALTLSRKADDKLGEARAHYVQALAKTHSVPPDFQGAETALSLSKADFERLHDLGGILKCTLLEAEHKWTKQAFLDAMRLLNVADSLVSDSSGVQFAPLMGLARGRLKASMLEPTPEIVAPYRNALKSFQPGKSEWMEAVLLQGMAEGFRDAKALDSALSYFMLAAEEYESLEAWEERMLMLAEGTKAALSIGDSSLAYELSTNAILALKRDTLSYARIPVMSAGGLRLLTVNKPDSAMRLLRQAVMQARKYKMPQLQADAHLSLSKGYDAMQDLFNAIRYADSASVLVDSLRNPELQEDIARWLTKLYGKAGDFRLALKYQQKAEVASDSLRTRNERIRLLSLQAKTEYERLKVVDDAEAPIEGDGGFPYQKKVFFWSMVGFSGLLLLVLVVVLVAHFRQKTKLKDLEYKVKLQEEEYSSLLEELVLLEKSSGRNSANLESLVDERTEALKKAVESLIEANEELDTFIYRASHDLLGPLARLKGLVTLAKSSSQPDDLRQNVELIATVSVYMERVLRKLIMIREMKNEVSWSKKLDIVDLIQGIQPLLHELPGIDHPEIVIQDWIQEPVKVNERNLKIVMENLLENACIFRKDTQHGNPKIEVNLKREGMGIIIEISDVGIGMPDKIRDQVFDLFFRGSPQSKGSGLGLYLVKRALDGMGGSIQVESKEGTFTKFTIRFPEA